MEGTSSKKESKVKVYLHRYFIDAMSAMAQGLFVPCSSAPSFPRSAHSLTFRCSMRLAGMQSPQPVPLWRSPSATRCRRPRSYCSRSSQSAGRGKHARRRMPVLSRCSCSPHRRELGKLVSKKTKVDIIVTPLVTIFSAAASRTYSRRTSARRLPAWATSSCGQPPSSRSSWAFSFPSSSALH